MYIPRFSDDRAAWCVYFEYNRSPESRFVCESKTKEACEEQCATLNLIKDEIDHLLSDGVIG
jgi:hypothetical protein